MSAQRASSDEIRVGVLHSKTGTMAISESAVIDATLMAIDEVNLAGGLLGRKVKAVVVDGRSDWPTFASEAERLVREEDVCTIFGCWTSASRRTVKPVVERLDTLLVYPVQYEGCEQSPNIVYMGAAPNQQIIPAIKWSFDNLGKRFYLIGSDYIFPRMANSIVKDQIRALGGVLAGEDYVLLGQRDVSAAVARLVEARPDVILNTINGDTNVDFFQALRKAGVASATTPTMSFSISETEVASIGPGLLAGDYAAWNYFMSVDTPENDRFVSEFKRRYGARRVTNDPIEAAYAGVHLWASAVRACGSSKPGEIRKAIGNQSMVAPEGLISIDPDTQHAWKVVRIGKIRPDGQFDIAWSSDTPVRPRPYPMYRRRGDWDKLVERLHSGWGNAWANPAKPDDLVSATGGKP